MLGDASEKGGVKGITDLRAETTWKRERGAMWKVENGL